MAELHISSQEGQSSLDAINVENKIMPNNLFRVSLEEAGTVTSPLKLLKPDSKKTIVMKKLHSTATFVIINSSADHFPNTHQFIQQNIKKL